MLLSICVLTVPAISMALAYWKIVKYYRETKRKLESAQQDYSGDGPPLTSRATILSTDEKVLLIKAIGITCAYFFCWFPYIIMIIVEASSGKPTSKQVDLMSALFGNAAPTVNAMVLLFFDNKVNLPKFCSFLTFVLLSIDSEQCFGAFRIKSAIFGLACRKILG